MKRRAFYSFHYAQDSWRAAEVRNIGAVEGNQPAKDNDWEEIKRGGNAAIERWIQSQMYGRSCTVVLVGSDTAGRKWIDYEITESWKKRMGVVGIHIHGLKNSFRKTSTKGRNPFSSFSYNKKDFSSVVKCYDPPGNNSQEKYNWIRMNLADVFEEAIRIRKSH